MRAVCILVAHHALRLEFHRFAILRCVHELSESESCYCPADGIKSTAVANYDQQGLRALGSPGIFGGAARNNAGLR